MGKKDKFASLQKGGGVGSFQESLVQAATTVAAIERQQEQTQKPEPGPTVIPQTEPVQDAPRFMRLPNPQIPVREYNLVSQYCSTFANMTRQDFVELAIIEKLHSEGQMPDDEFSARQKEIRSRPPRGQRKGTKQPSK